MEARVVVLLITSERISKAEIVTNLTEAFDSSFKEELAISVIIIEGEFRNYSIVVINFSYFCCFAALEIIIAYHDQISSCGSVMFFISY